MIRIDSKTVIMGRERTRPLQRLKFGWPKFGNCAISQLFLREQVNLNEIGLS